MSPRGNRVRAAMDAAAAVLKSMARPNCFLLTLVLGVLTFGNDGVLSKTRRELPILARIAELPTERPVVQGEKLAPPDTTVLALYDFDDSSGQPDSQGWEAKDLTAQPRYWHVDDFHALTIAPLQGSRSLWCGIRRDEAEDSPPYFGDGYGNLWHQYYQSRAFPVSGTVTLDMDIRYDMEPGYDYFSIEYTNGTGSWVYLCDRSGSLTQEHIHLMIDGADHAGTVSFRLRFDSDGAYSDEDGLWNTSGAVIVDALSVQDATGVLDYENFEDEAVWALGTGDGDWTAGTDPAYGIHAGLVDGEQVLQENTTTPNASNLWAFYVGSPATYACGGHPEQTAVPWSTTPHSEASYEYLANEIRSPWISLGKDAAGAPQAIFPDSLVVRYSVYRDLPSANLVGFSYRLRFGRQLEDGSVDVDGWVDNHLTYFSSSHSWYRGTFKALYPGIRNVVQVALRASDVSWFFGPINGWPQCHSHAPLYDDINISGLSSVERVVLSGPGSIIVPVNTPTPVITGCVRIPGVTEAPGQGANVSARIVYGAPGSDLRGADYYYPWPYVNAPYVGEADGGDVFGAQLTGIPAGQYAYCIHVLYGSGMGAYGELDGSENGFSTNQTGTLFVGPVIVGAELTGPATVSAIAGSPTESIMGRVLIKGVVPAPGATGGVAAQLGYGPDGSDPVASPELWQWVAATYEADVDSLEQYTGALTAGSVGQYDYALRFQYNGGPWAFGDLDGSTNGYSPEQAGNLVVGAPTDVPGSAITQLRLYPNHPNPFNPMTTIRFDLPAGGPVRLAVYDLVGRLVRVLAEGEMDGGTHEAVWDGRDSTGRSAPSGSYLARLVAGGKVEGVRLSLVR